MAPGSKAEQKAALDLGAWMFNVVTFVGIIMVNKSLMTTHGFSFASNIAKPSIIPLLCILEVIFENLRYSRDTKLSMVVVLVGVAVCTVSDVSVNAQIRSCSLRHCIATAWRLEHMQKLCPINALKKYVNYLQLKYSLNSLKLYCTSKQFLIVLSCVIAVRTNLSQFICIGRFTAVTFQVTGHMKTILVLTLGFLFFGKEGVNLHVVMGMVLAVVGMI